MLKRTPAKKREINKLLDAGVSMDEISKRVGLSVGSVHAQAVEHRAQQTAPVRAAAPTLQDIPPMAPAPAPPTTEPAKEEDLDRFLLEQIAEQRQYAAECKAMGDPSGQQKAWRAMTMAMTLRAKLKAKEPNKGELQISKNDLEVAAHKARTRLGELLARLLGESESLPTCPHCGGRIRP
jgi:hypothetical protein